MIAQPTMENGRNLVMIPRAHADGGAVQRARGSSQGNGVPAHVSLANFLEKFAAGWPMNPLAARGRGLFGSGADREKVTG
jgi:hypothetical protein